MLVFSERAWGLLEPFIENVERQGEFSPGGFSLEITRSVLPERLWSPKAIFGNFRAIGFWIFEKIRAIGFSVSGKNRAIGFGRPDRRSLARVRPVPGAEAL